MLVVVVQLQCIVAAHCICLSRPCHLCASQAHACWQSNFRKRIESTKDGTHFCFVASRP
jgi:hypothetical protein